LLAGQYREGFREYEWRWKSAYIEGQQPKIHQPLWDGSFLAGKRILLHAEQGLGDTIQLTRYLPLVEKLGGRIVLSVPGSLGQLMSSLPGGHFVLPEGATVSDFATHCPLFSLPLMFGTDLESSSTGFLCRSRRSPRELGAAHRRRPTQDCLDPGRPCRTY
jgi:hypothetical protein